MSVISEDFSKVGWSYSSVSNTVTLLPEIHLPVHIAELVWSSQSYSPKA